MEPSLKVTIVLMPDGSIKLNAEGPAAGNKLALVGAIELAKAAVLNQQQAQPVSPLLLARHPLPGHNGG